jgi:hypothetical protein
MKSTNKMLPVAMGLCALLAFGGTTANAGTDDTSSPIAQGELTGEAYSIDIDLEVGAPLLGNVASVRVGPVPRAKIDPDGGMDVSTLANLNLLDLVSSKTLFNVSTGAVTGNVAAVHSVSTIEDLELVKGMLQADALSTYCSSTTDGTTASSEGHSRLLGLRIGGKTINIVAPENEELSLVKLTLEKDGLFAPAYLVAHLLTESGEELESVGVLVTQLTDVVQELLNTLLGDLLEQLLNSLLGTTEVPVLTLYLNQQMPAGDGETISSMSNNALHVHINTDLLSLLDLGTSDLQLASGDIFISATECGVEVNTEEPQPEPEPDEGFVTGGGFIGMTEPDVNFASFGFNARPNKGHLNYIDHDTDTHIQGYTVGSISVEGSCATFSGLAKIDDVEGYTYTAKVCDNGEPGRSDTFDINTSNGYVNGGTLAEGGNIQLH